MTQAQKDRAVKFLEGLEKSANDYNSTPSRKNEENIFHLNLASWMGERVAAFFREDKQAAKGK